MNNMGVNELRMGIIRTELNHVNKGTARILKDTIAVFRNVNAYLVHVVCDNVSDILSLSPVLRCSAVEKLTHRTKDNPGPAYEDFDLLFYKLPSYIRRAAINNAVGHVQSHETRCDRYYERREAEIARGHHYKKMESAFTYTPNACPTMYKDRSFKQDGTTISIKARVRNTWDWITVSMPKRDYKCLMKAADRGELKNPKLVYEYGKFYLQFPILYDYTKFPETGITEQKVLGVDLGLTNGAVCSVTDFTGTICGRDFSPFQEDMDRIDHIISLIRKTRRTSGRNQSLSRLYTKLKGLKENYARQLARWIVNIAFKYRVYGIVLEYLDIHRRCKKKGLRARVHNWCTAKIRDYIKGMAFREGIRVFLINPKNTSRLAFDGSGPVLRGKESSKTGGNYSLCEFSTGKLYNCDLSASYNIGARYFIRAIKKSTPATEWSEFVAKVPGLSKGTDWTLDTLRKLSALKCPEKAAII